MNRILSALAAPFLATAVLLGCAFPAAAVPGSVAPPSLTALVPLNAYGFSCANSGATNTAIFAAAVAAGQTSFSIKGCATPYALSAALPVTTGISIVGENSNTVILQPPTNTAGITAVGNQIWLQNLTIQYASPEPIANTTSACLQVGSSSTYLYYSHIQNVACINANTGILATSTFGEFQNTWLGFRMQKFSKHGIYETATNSGSSYTNTRIQNTDASGLPPSADCTDAINFTNGFNLSFNTTNIEFLNCTNAEISLNQSAVTFSGLHFEQVYQGNFLNMFEMDFQSIITINDLSIQNSTFNGTSSSIFNFYTIAGSGGANTVTVNGFTELGNTFTTKLPWTTDDGNFNHVYIKGINGRNSGNVVLTTRNNLSQYEGYLTDTPGGRIIAGCVGTTAPTGGMPLPFATAAGVALPWVVGDRCNNTTPTSTSTTGWRNTTAGSPGIFTAEPVL